MHHATHIRAKRDGLKVGGHQASSASITAIMAALYFHALRPPDKVAVKPQAGRVLQAINYMLGQQTLDQLQRFRGIDGAQSYPFRMKDQIPVDFSTGSARLGVAITAFSGLFQDYLIAHGEMDEADAGRMFCRFDDIFETCGWRVITLNHGKLQLAAFPRPGGKAIEEWIETCPNADFAVLTYQGGAAWRARLMADIGGQPNVQKLIESFDDDRLAALMTNLGGHCIETLMDAFDSADDETPTMFIAYTVRMSATAVFKLRLFSSWLGQETLPRNIPVVNFAS